MYSMNALWAKGNSEYMIVLSLPFSSLPLAYSGRIVNSYCRWNKISILVKQVKNREKNIYIVAVNQHDNFEPYIQKARYRFAPATLSIAPL